MSRPASTASRSGGSIGLLITLTVSLFYAAWLGAHWLPLDYSDQELAAIVSRVWDIKRELVEHNHLAWWTPYYMSGFSYGLGHAQGFYLIPWLLLSTVTSLQVAGKLIALASIVASAGAMYFCARHFMKNEWAASLASLAYAFHPQLLYRSGGTEHIGPGGAMMVFPLFPLVWLFFAKALESRSYRDVFWCAVTMVWLAWVSYKLAFVLSVFLMAYLIYVLWKIRRNNEWLAGARSAGLIGATALALGAFLIIPLLMETKHVSLFPEAQLKGWQRSYSFKSLLALVDRNGLVTEKAIQSVRAELQMRGSEGVTRKELEKARSLLSMSMDSPEKYAGIVLLGLIAVTVVFPKQRTNRGFFRFSFGMLLLSVMLATGHKSVWEASRTTWGALFEVDGVPPFSRVAVVLLLAVIFILLVVLAQRKLTTRPKRIAATGALVFFFLVPAFQLPAHLPFFENIRAPYIFYDMGAPFFGALLVGFFVTDVVNRGTREKNGTPGWPARTPAIVGGVAILMLLDFWPYQKLMMDNRVPARTLKNLRATYTALKDDPDWVKTYSVSSRPFHLLGPMYGNKPQVSEAWNSWMSPVGTGLLSLYSGRTVQSYRAYLNLMGVRYIVVDKTDPKMSYRRAIEMFSQYFRIAENNEDFVVFLNAEAQPYVRAYADWCLFVGDVRQSPALALALAERHFPLVHTTLQGNLAGFAARSQGRISRIYVNGRVDRVQEELPESVGARIVPIWRNVPRELPPASGTPVSLSDVKLERGSSHLIRIDLTAPKDSLVVIAESYYPYWRAEIDGKPAEILRVSTGLMGVELTKGTHKIVLRYVPPRAYLFAGLFSLAVLVTCAGWMIWTKRSKRDSASRTV